MNNKTDKFTDSSAATDIEKAIRFLVGLSNADDSGYFYDDGFPRVDALARKREWLYIGLLRSK